MKLRTKTDHVACSSSRFNMHSVSEIVVYYDDPPDCDSDFIRNYDVWLTQSKTWKLMEDAFRDHDLIVDNYNTTFFEPVTAEDRERGHTC